MDVTNHELFEYNLKIYDDDYLSAKQPYSVLAYNVGMCWDGFIQICRELQGTTIKGVFADKVDEYVEALGNQPAKDVRDTIQEITDNMTAYISAIDDADGKLY